MGSGRADGGTKEFVYCGRCMVADFLIEKLPKYQGSFKVMKFLLTPLAADRAAAVAAVAAVGETRFRGATRLKVAEPHAWSTPLAILAGVHFARKVI